MINLKSLFLRFKLLYLISLFLLSFVNGLITQFAYIFVFGSAFFALLTSKVIIVPKYLQIFTGLVLIWSILQYVILGDLAWKSMLNFCGFMIGILSVATIISKLTKAQLSQFNFYLRSFIFVLGSMYALSPVIEYGFTGTFFIDGNYLYASASRFITNALTEKQMMSSFLLLYVVVCVDILKKNMVAMPVLIPFIYAINMLLASRSQVIGIMVALFLIVIIRNRRFIKTKAVIISAFTFLAVFIMSLDVFTELHNLDIRVMLFHAAAITFLSNFLFGVGIFYLPQILSSNNQTYLSNFAYLYPDGWGSLSTFPTGFESSFLQFVVELGVVYFFLLYFAVKWLLNNYYHIDAKFKYLAFFGIVYFFSSITEDNLTQPPIYMLSAIFLGLYISRCRENLNSCLIFSNNTKSLISSTK